MADFYPLTSETLSKLYEANLTAPEWRLWAYLSVIELSCLPFDVLVTGQEVGE